MDSLPEVVLGRLFIQLPLTDLLNLNDAVAAHSSLKWALQRLVWSRITDIYWDAYGKLLLHSYNWSSESSYSSQQSQALIYWRGQLWRKCDWLRVTPEVKCSGARFRTQIMEKHLPAEPNQNVDQPKVLVKLVYRCSGTLKQLVFASATVPYETPAGRFRCASGPALAEGVELLSTSSLRLLSAVLRIPTCLESLVINCAISGNHLAELLSAPCMPSAFQLKRLCLQGCLGRAWLDAGGRYSKWVKQQGLIEFISGSEFSRVLSSLPGLEQLISVDTGCTLHLPLGTLPRFLQCLRLDMGHMAGHQLRELVSNCPLLEELLWVTIGKTHAPVGEQEAARGLISQHDLDYFCSNAKRLKCLGVCIATPSTIELKFTEIASLNRLLVDVRDGAKYPSSIRLPFEELGHLFPALHSLSIPYPVTFPTLCSLMPMPPHLRRLSICCPANHTTPLDMHLSDGQLMALFETIGKEGRQRIEEFQLVNSPRVTNNALAWIFNECTRLREFEHRRCSLDSGQLINDLGVTLTERAAASDSNMVWQLEEGHYASGSDDQGRFRLIQYIDYKNEASGRGSTSLHPMITMDWRVELLHKAYVAEYYRLH